MAGEPPIDIHCRTWITVAEWVQAELKDCREQLEGLTIPHDRSNQLRGRIEQLKLLLALPSASDPKPTQADVQY
jgi:hypothetical protein